MAKKKDEAPKAAAKPPKGGNKSAGAKPAATKRGAARGR